MSYFKPLGCDCGSVFGRSRMQNALTLWLGGKMAIKHLNHFRHGIICVGLFSLLLIIIITIMDPSMNPVLINYLPELIEFSWHSTAVNAICRALQNATSHRAEKRIMNFKKKELKSINNCDGIVIQTSWQLLNMWCVVISIQLKCRCRRSMFAW